LNSCKSNTVSTLAWVLKVRTELTVLTLSITAWLPLVDVLCNSTIDETGVLSKSFLAAIE
jgi:hypothetical protein